MWPIHATSDSSWGLYPGKALHTNGQSQGHSAPHPIAVKSATISVYESQTFSHLFLPDLAATFQKMTVNIVNNKVDRAIYGEKIHDPGITMPQGSWTDITLWVSDPDTSNWWQPPPVDAAQKLFD